MSVNTSSSVPSTGYAKDRFLSSIKRHFISRINSCVLGVKRSFLQTGSTGSDSKSENDRQSLPQEAQRFGSEHKELTILDCLVDEVTWDDRRELNRNNQDFLTGKQRKKIPLHLNETFQHNERKYDLFSEQRAKPGFLLVTYRCRRLHTTGSNSICGLFELEACSLDQDLKSQRRKRRI